MHGRSPRIVGRSAKLDVLAALDFLEQLPRRLPGDAGAHGKDADAAAVPANDTLAGEFIHVPDAIARGTTADQPQTALENWSNANNVFQFVRVEDMDYDPDNPRVVYFTDTGSTRIKEGPSGRLIRAGASDFPYFDTNGRVFKMVLNADDPTQVDSLTIHAEGRLVQQDAGPVTTVIQAGVGFLNPDNLDVGHASLMVQEDAANAKIWRNDLGTTWTHVGTVNHPTAPSAVAAPDSGSVPETLHGTGAPEPSRADSVV